MTKIKKIVLKLLKKIANFFKKVENKNDMETFFEEETSEPIEINTSGKTVPPLKPITDREKLDLHNLFNFQNIISEDLAYLDLLARRAFDDRRMHHHNQKMTIIKADDANKYLLFLQEVSD